MDRSDEKITKLEPEEKKEEQGFAEIMKKNAENKKRMEEERKKSNKAVKRSYRLDK